MFICGHANYLMTPWRYGLNSAWYAYEPQHEYHAKVTHWAQPRQTCYRTVGHIYANSGGNMRTTNIAQIQFEHNTRMHWRIANWSSLYVPADTRAVPEEANLKRTSRACKWPCTSSLYFASTKLKSAADSHLFYTADTFQTPQQGGPTKMRQKHSFAAVSTATPCYGSSL